MKMVRKLTAGICAAVMLSTAVPLTAFAKNEDAYKTPSGLAFDKVGDAIEEYAENNKKEYTAFSAAVVSDEEVLYSGAFGEIDRDAGTPADADTCYEWGSISKTMIWVSVMQLWEQGRIDLNEDIRTYLPDHFFGHLKYDDKITMLNLMNHEGGWGENFWSIQTDDENAIVPLEQALKASEPSQNTRPGAVSSYCNWSAALAAYIVERISGEPFSDYAHKHIMEPLGMEQTAILPAHDDNEWVKAQREKVKCAAQSAPGVWKEAGGQLTYIQLYPAGAVTGTIGDLAKYAQSFVQDPCPLFEKQETLEEMLRPSSTIGDTEYPAFCHGLIPQISGDQIYYGHSGATNGFSSNLMFDPESGTAAVVMMIGSGEPATKIPELVFGEASVPEFEAKAPLTGDYSGVYFILRGVLHGPLRMVYSALGTTPLTKDGDKYSALGIATVTPLGDGTGLLEQQGIRMLTSLSEQDGEKYFSVGGMQSYHTDGWMLAGLVFLVIYIIIMLIGFLLLFIKLIQRIAKARKKYTGMGLITLSQILRPVVIALPVLCMVLLYSHQYGLTKLQGYLLCGAEFILMLVFAATAIRSLTAIFKQDRGEAGVVKYVINFLANGFCVFAMIALELIRFWGI